jgi:Na+/H+ antiporter NhaA
VDHELSIRLGSHGLSLDLRHWLNQGLMTFFFLVVGLEAKCELDVGELRERRRITVPVAAAVGGATVPVLVLLAFNAGGSGTYTDPRTLPPWGFGFCDGGRGC